MTFFPLSFNKGEGMEAKMMFLHHLWEIKVPRLFGEFSETGRMIFLK